MMVKSIEGEIEDKKLKVSLIGYLDWIVKLSEELEEIYSYKFGPDTGRGFIKSVNTLKDNIGGLENSEKDNLQGISNQINLLNANFKNERKKVAKPNSQEKLSKPERLLSELIGSGKEFDGYIEELSEANSEKKSELE